MMETFSMNKCAEPGTGKHPRAAGIVLAACVAALCAFAASGCTMLVEEWDVPELNLLELDREFGTSGEARFVTADTNEFAYAGAVQSDGKIVVAGKVWNGSNHDIQMVRFNANGTVDTDFGAGGAYVHGISENDSARAVAIQEDGKIVVAGVSGEGNEATSIVVIRLNEDGSPDDTGFGTGGIVITDTPGTYDDVCSIAAQDDGTILVGGSAYFDATYNRDFLVVRYQSNGAIDTTFGSSGFARAQDTDSPLGKKMAVQGDGKIVVAGYFGSSGRIARLNANGSLDTGFGSSGYVTDSQCVATTMCLDESGRIVTAGIGSDLIAVSRFTGTGAPDGTFGTGGSISIDRKNSESINDIHDVDGKIVLLDDYYRLYRFNDDGVEDGSFHAADEEESRYAFDDNHLYSLRAFSTGIHFELLCYTLVSTFFLFHEPGKIVVGGHADLVDGDIPTDNDYFFRLGRILVP